MNEDLAVGPYGSVRAYRAPQQPPELDTPLGCWDNSHYRDATSTLSDGKNTSNAFDKGNSALVTTSSSIQPKSSFNRYTLYDNDYRRIRPLLRSNISADKEITLQRVLRVIHEGEIWLRLGNWTCPQIVFLSTSS